MAGGRELAFVRTKTDSPAVASLMRRPWDGSVSATTVFSRSFTAGRAPPIGATTWLPDGRRAVVQIARDGSTPSPGRGASGDLMMLSLDAPDSLRPFIVTEFSEGTPAVSPDGRALAYSSNESGRTEVYVRPIAGGALRQVSINGGTQPKWARSGRELFFRNADTVFAARIATAGELTVDRVTPVLSGGNLASGYAVGPGDSLFIMRAAPTGERPATVSLVVVMNIATELRRMFGSPDRRSSPGS